MGIARISSADLEMKIVGQKIAIVWRGDPVSRSAATPENNRYHQIFSELLAVGIEAEPAVYCEEMQDEFHAQLMKTEGALVWVNPLEGDRTREKLDALLRDVVSTGRLISAHPDVILKMGVKELLHRTRHLGWGTVARGQSRRYALKERKAPSPSTTLAESFEVRHGYVSDNVGIAETTAEG